MRRAAFRALFVTLVALYVHGFLMGRLFEQEIWTAQGLHRLGWFLACYAVAGGALLLARPGWFSRAWVFAAAVYVVVACGVAAPAAVALFLASSWALGRRIAPGLVGTALGLNVWAVAVGLAVHLPVNHPAVYALAFCVPLVCEWRRLREVMPEAVRWMRTPPPCTLRQTVPVAVLGLVLAMHLALVPMPEISADGLAMHLAIPASVAAHHGWNFDARQTAWAVMPMQADWCYTAVYLLGGETAARLFNFAALALLLALLYDLGRRVLSPGGSLWLAALFASSPILQLVTGSLFVENFWSLTLLGSFAAVVRYRESGRTRWPLAAAALLGGGLAAKYGSVAFVLPASVVLGIELWRQRALRLIPALVVLVLAFGATPYARAYLETGNPVFPFFNQVFRSPYFDSQSSFLDHRFDRSLTVRTIYDATLRTHLHLEAQDGGWAFQYLLFVPLALLLLRRESSYLEWAALAVAVPCVVLTLAKQSNIRYLCPALPLLTLVIAGLFAALSRCDRGALRAASAAATAIFILNLGFLPASGWYHKDFSPGVLSSRDREAYLAMKAPVRNLAAWLNRHRPGEAVVFLENNHIAGLRGPAYTTSWHNQAFQRELGDAGSAEDCQRVIDRLGVHEFIAPAGIERVTHPHLRRLLAAFGETERESGGWRVVRWSAPRSAGWPPEEPVPPGTYDDMNPRVRYSGVWNGDRQFFQPSGGSITYSDTPGASVRLTFHGSGITWVYTKAANRGRARVTLDGQESLVDLYSPETVWRARSSFGAPGEGPHSFEAEVLPEKDPASTGRYIDVDALIVLRYPESQPAR